jgi:hypothetical protein
MANCYGRAYNGLFVCYKMASSRRRPLQDDSGSEVVEFTNTLTPQHHRKGETDRVLEHGSLSGELVGLRIW